MIVALLVLIVLILLFGAGIVKGWIANAVTMGCGFITICLALIWLGSFFGENGFLYVLLAIGGIMLLLAAFAVIFNDHAPPEPSKISRPPISADRPRQAPKPKPPTEQPPVDRVWGWFAQDIALRFSPESRGQARQLYDAGDVLALERFLRAESERLNQIR